MQHGHMDVTNLLRCTVTCYDAARSHVTMQHGHMDVTNLLRCTVTYYDAARSHERKKVAYVYANATVRLITRTVQRTQCSWHFYRSSSTAPLSQRKPASTDTCCDGSGVEGKGRRRHPVALYWHRTALACMAASHSCQCSVPVLGSDCNQWVFFQV